MNYTYEQAEIGEDMGITFHLYDAEENEITSGSGSASVEPDENGVHWCSMEMQSFDEVPESIWLEAKVIGWDKTLGRVECRLVESTEANQNKSIYPDIVISLALNMSVGDIPYVITQDP